MGSGTKITVLSAGWGAALAVMADKRGADVTLWSPFEEEIESIRRYGEHRKLLPGVPIPPSIALTTDLSGTADAGLVIMTTPSFAIRDTARKLAAFLRPGTPLVCASKGVESGTYKRFSQVLAEEVPQARVVALSGPSHAEEVGRHEPTTVICASTDMEAAELVQDELTSASFRIYVNPDIIGVELGGALKNIVALAAGMCDGIGLGDNAKAALMTRGLAEMARLGMAMGARSETFAGLSGMGDLIVTCGSQHSRNRRAGMLIGQGLSPEEAVQKVGTVEGYHAAKAGRELARQAGVEMPITEQCYRICYEGVAPLQSIKTLLGRPHRQESEPLWRYSV